MTSFNKGKIHIATFVKLLVSLCPCVFVPFSSKRITRGFTLIEVLISIVILSVGLVMVVEAMGRTQHGLRISQNLVLANQFIEEKITDAEIEVRQYGKLRFGSDEDTYVLPGKKFRWKRNVDAYRDETIEDETKLNRVRIDMVWNDGPARVNNVRAETLMVNREEEE